jgi:hypothetical protein
MSEVAMKVWIRGFRASDSVPFAGRRDREAGLDDVDAQPVELAGDLDLLLRVQRDAGRLLAVPERRVEDTDGVRF